MTKILHCLALRQKTVILTLLLSLQSVFMIIESAAVAADSYSLGDLYRLALEKSESIKMSEENLVISKLNRDKAFSALIPTLSAFGGYTKFTEDKQSSTGSIMQPDYNGSWGVKLEKSLSVSGREFIALKGAMDNIEKNRYELMAVKEEYLASVGEAFYSVLQARQTVQIADTNLERLRKYQEAAEKRLHIGEVTKTALLRAKGEVSGALSDHIKAKNRLSMGKVLLARIVGIKSDFDLIDNDYYRDRQNGMKIDPEAPEQSSLPRLQEIAETSRYELRSLKAELEMAKKQIDYTRGALWPTATVSSVYSRLDQSPKSGSGYNDEAVSASLYLNFPLYDGGSRKVDIKEAEAQKRQIDLMYKDQEKIIKVEVENAFLDVNAQKSVIKYLEDQLLFATSNYYAIAKQFEFGLSDSMDMIDANNLLLTSQLKLSDARYNYRLSVLKLKRAIGGLLREIGKIS